MNKELRIWKRLDYKSRDLFIIRHRMDPSGGNNRMVLDSSGEVIQATNYYAFGSSFAENPAHDDQYYQPYKHSGKELDRMFGLDSYDFLARTYDPILARFTTMDPLCEKYYSISPYAYCRNNPVNRIDPDGRDDYEVNSRTGHIFFIRRSEEHTLYVTGARGGRTGKSLTLKDNSIFEGLANTAKDNDWKKSFSIGDANSRDAMLETFKFLSDNTGVEWKVDKFKENGENRFSIGSVHKSNLAITSEQMGHSTESVAAFIHSHPGVSRNSNQELGSMGYIPPNNYATDNRGRGSDIDAKTNNPAFRNTSYNTYFPNSGNLWNVRAGQKSAFVRNVGTYKGFWGTFNAR